LVLFFRTPLSSREHPRWVHQYWKPCFTAISASAFVAPTHAWNLCNDFTEVLMDNAILKRAMAQTCWYLARISAPTLPEQMQDARHV
jgi:hypothetical protein